MNGRGLKYFMWGYQSHIRLNFQTKAESLFGKFSNNLKPEVSLIGIRNKDYNGHYPICAEIDSTVEADIDNFVSKFSDLNELALQLEKIDPNGAVLHSDEYAQKQHEIRIHQSSYGNAIKKILEKDVSLDDLKFFISNPVQIENHLVYVVIQINNQEYVNFHSLRNSNNGQFFVFKSLLDALFDEFVKSASYALNDPYNPYDGIRESDHELIRKAAQKLMYTAAIPGANIMGVHGLFDTCNEISSLRYEGAEGIGSLIIAERNHKNVRMTLQLKKPISIREHRKVRKFLEMSDGSASIISDSQNIYGLGELDGNYNSIEESLFEVKFVKHYEWILYHANVPLMTVQYGIPNLPKSKIQRDNFYSDVRRIFSDIPSKNIDTLWDIITESMKQRHGTMIVISEKANQEANRLGNQCFQIEPQLLPRQMITQITSIDGALLIDHNGICYATGVILDGIATEAGDSSRGARYNSALRYYEHVKDNIPTMIVIVSEDGMIDIVPKLNPLISKKEIERNIQDFKLLSKDDAPNYKMFNDFMSYFKQVSFYLTEQECMIINETRRTIESKYIDRNIKILYEDFKPNNEMNESYYAENN